MKPLGTLLAILPENKEMVKNNIILTTDTKHSPEKGKVFEIGDDCGKIKKGDKVIFRKEAYTTINIDGKDILLMDKKSIYAII